MRNTLRWLLLFALPIAALCLTGLPEHAHAIAMHGGSVATLLTPLAIGLATIATPPSGGITLQNKNRQANEFRAQASALRKELLDPAKVFTKEELEKRAADINAIELRANMIAEFTADEEIRRQNDDPGSLEVDDIDDQGQRRSVELERVDGPESGQRSAYDGHGSKTITRARSVNALQGRIAAFTRAMQAEFVDVRSFMKMAVNGAGRPTPAQLKIIQDAHVLTRAIVGTTGDVSGGEFLLPLTQVQTIFSLVNVQQGLLQRARAYNVPGRTLRIPYLLQTDEDASTELDRPMAGNIANVSIVGEGSTKPPRPPKFGQRLLNIYKYAAITQVSDELLGDDFTGELPSEFVNAVGQQALNAVNEDITIDGTGSGEPFGALYPSSAYNIAVTRQTGGTITPVDVFAMYSQFTHGPNAVWLASRRTVQALYNMSLTSASLVTFLKDLSGTPQMMLLGYPIVLTDLLPTLGSAGDFALVNPDFYAFALRQALTVQSSEAPGFIEDLTTYRFIVRAGGLTINTGKYAYKYTGSQGVDEHSPFVYLN